MGGRREMLLIQGQALSLMVIWRVLERHTLSLNSNTAVLLILWWNTFLTDGLMTQVMEECTPKPDGTKVIGWQIT